MTFVAAFRERLAPGLESPDEQALAALVAAVRGAHPDVTLGACLAGEPAAPARVDAILSREVEIAWARIDTPGADAADGKQRLRERLLVGAEARIVEYSGRGDLRAWVKVVAVRRGAAAAPEAPPREPDQRRSAPHAGRRERGA